MNVYDVALDFVLLDAFSDLESPPSAVVAVLQNSWITDGMKKSVSLLQLRTQPTIPLSPPGSVGCSVVTAEGKEEHAESQSLRNSVISISVCRTKMVLWVVSTN